MALFNAERRHERVATCSEGTPDGRWRPYTYEAIVARDKANMDITWLRDETPDDGATLPAPGVLAAGIVEDLRAVLAQLQRSPTTWASPVIWTGNAEERVVLP